MHQLSRMFNTKKDETDLRAASGKKSGFVSRFIRHRNGALDDVPETADDEFQEALARYIKTCDK